jgi:hypothetical protein
MLAGRRSSATWPARGWGCEQNRGTTPCKANWPCTGAADAEHGLAAGSRASRQRWRTVVVDVSALQLIVRERLRILMVNDTTGRQVLIDPKRTMTKRTPRRAGRRDGERRQGLGIHAVQFGLGPHGRRGQRGSRRAAGDYAAFRFLIECLAECTARPHDASENGDHD